MLKRNMEIERDVFDDDVPDWAYTAWIEDDERAEDFYDILIDNKCDYHV